MLITLKLALYTLMLINSEEMNKSKENIEIFKEIRFWFILTTILVVEYEYLSTPVKHTKSTALSTKHRWF